MLGHPEFEAAIRSAPRKRLRGFATRFIAERYRRTALSPIGALQRGGRFNRPGSPALYSSFKRITALREATHLLADDDPAIPYLMLTIEFDLANVLDLTASAVTVVLGTTRAELTRPVANFRSGHNFTQSLGAAAAAVGCDGLVEWSRADPRGKNLVIFTERTTPGSFVVYDDPPRRFESFELVERGTIVPFRPRRPNE